MLRTQLWTLMTCPCQVEETWDDSIPLDQDQVVSSRSIIKCPDHAALTTTHYATVRGENRRVGRMVAECKNVPKLQQTIINPDGTTTLDFKSGVSLALSWSGTGDSRVLLVSVIGVSLTNSDKQSLQAKADQLFGVGKVVIQ